MRKRTKLNLFYRCSIFVCLCLFITACEKTIDGSSIDSCKASIEALTEGDSVLHKKLASNWIKDLEQSINDIAFIKERQGDSDFDTDLVRLMLCDQISGFDLEQFKTHISDWKAPLESVLTESEFQTLKTFQEDVLIDINTIEKWSRSGVLTEQELQMFVEKISPFINDLENLLGVDTEVLWGEYLEFYKGSNVREFLDGVSTEDPMTTGLAAYRTQLDSWRSDPNNAFRQKVSECINVAAIPKLAISEYYETTGKFPERAEDAALTELYRDHCGRFDNFQSNQEIQVFFEIDIDEGALGYSSGIIQPRITGSPNSYGGLDWDCSKGSTSEAAISALPASCRD